ncbi:MAG: hypothetical protein WAL61_05595 [Acidimicrobiales bacterium]
MDRTTSALRRWDQNSRDERGATFVITAVAMVLLLWAGAMGVDIGFVVDGNQQAQAVADTGAIDMARYINIADGNTTAAAFNAYMNAKLTNVGTDNALNGETLSWVAGTWSTGGGFKAATNPCYGQTRPGNPACTAVKITATQSVPRIFAGGSGAATRSAIGYLNPMTGFSIGTYLANLNTQQGPVLNGIMSQLSASANLSLVSYEGLADTFVSARQLIAASSAAGVVLSPTNVLNTSLTAGQWLAVFKAAAYNQQVSLNCASTPEPSPCVAYTALQSLTGGSGPSSATLCQLVSIEGSACGGELSQSQLASSINMLQTLETEAELANGTSGIDLGTSLGLSGVTDAVLALNVIQPPQVAYGPAGATPATSATTAQVSSTLKLTVVGVGEIDVTLGAAQGTAAVTPNSFVCNQTTNSFKGVAITASTTAATGNVTLIDSALGVNEPVASTSVSGVNNTVIPFTAPVPPTTSQFGAASGANPYQIGSTSPQVTITTLGGLTAPVTALLATPPVSTLISQLQTGLSGVLQAGGVTVAGADIADTSANCDSVSLAQ